MRVSHTSFGFTLTEVLIALGIVAFGLLSLLTLLPVGLRSTGLAGDLTTAALLAEQELGRIRANAAVRDFIDSNLDDTLDATDFNGVQDPGEPFETGWRFSNFSDIALVNAAPPVVATGMAFPPEYSVSNVGTGAFIAAADQVAALGAGTAHYDVDTASVTDTFVFTAIEDGPTADFAVVGRTSGALAVATSSGNYNPATNELQNVWIPDGRTAGDGQDTVLCRDWVAGDTFTIRTCMECRDADGLGYFELPATMKKGRLKDVRAFGTDDVTPPIAQTWTITCSADPSSAVPADPPTFDVVGSVSGDQGNATAGIPFTATSEELTFLITENNSRIYDGETAYNGEWREGDRLEITVVVVENAWYAYYAQRMDYGEDRLFAENDFTNDGIDNDGDGTIDNAGEEDELDGVLTGVRDPAATPALTDDYRPEDTGLDLMPSFIDENGDGVADAAEPAGEAGFNRVTNPDPSGDDGVTENNRRNIQPFPADRLPEHEVQRVVVTVTWREGGRSREAHFSSVVANPYPWP